jgi:hypothetical protein
MDKSQTFASYVYASVRTILVEKENGRVSDLPPEIRFAIRRRRGCGAQKDGVLTVSSDMAPDAALGLVLRAMGAEVRRPAVEDDAIISC